MNNIEEKELRGKREGDVVYFLYNKEIMRSGIWTVYRGEVYGIRVFGAGREFIFTSKELFESKEALIRAIGNQ